MTSILTNSYFSGAGLMDIGLESGGLTLQQSFEIDRVCCETMRRNLSHEVIQCDITQKLVHHEKQCHVMVATYPCTKYSPIADIHGVRTGDDLFLSFLPPRCHPETRTVRCRECAGHEEVPSGDGSNDEAPRLLRSR